MVCERLSVMPDEARQNLHRLRLDSELVVLGSEQLRYLARLLCLVEGLDVEPDRECLHRIRAELGHRGDDGARVDAAGEKRAERHVASKPEPGRLEQLGPDPLIHLVLGAVVIVGAVGELPVAADLDPAVLPGQQVRRGQLSECGEGALRMGDVLELEEGVDRVEVDIARNLGIPEDRLRLRGEPEAAVAGGVEEGLLADPVARQQQTAAAAVPDGEREHAAQVIDAGVSVILVEVGDHLGVRPGREAMPARLAAPDEARGSCRSRRSGPRRSSHPRWRSAGRRSRGR